MRAISVWILICVALAVLAIPSAWADSACETGCMGAPNPDSCRASCRHYDSLRGGGGASRPPSFAAIAVTRDGKHYGHSARLESQAAAQQKALEICRAEPGNTSDCVIGVWFYNSCGALVRGDQGAWGADWGASPRQAIAKATKTCQQHGTNCAPVRAYCTN